MICYFLLYMVVFDWMMLVLCDVLIGCDDVFDCFEWLNVYNLFIWLIDGDWWCYCYYVLFL